MMRTRVLGKAEWATKLAGTYLAPVVTMLPPDTTVLAVEQDGEVVGCWAAYPVWHMEGVWVRPDKRGGGVLRSLKRAMLSLLHGKGATFAYTAAQSPDVARLITNLMHGRPLPAAEHYVCPIRKE